MSPKINYRFTALMKKHGDKGAWYFIAFPKDLSKEIRDNLKWQEEGWGRMKAIAQIGDTKWDTAIWFDSKTKVYALPVKAEIRRKLQLEVNKATEVSVWV